MSCEITLGRKEPCKDAIGGIDKILILNFQEYVYTEASGVITDIKEADGIAEATAHEYVLRDGVSNLVETVNSSRANGTTFVEQVITAQLKKRTAIDQEELMLLIYGQPIVIVKDNNGLYWLCGKEWGTSVNTGTSPTGAAMGDFNGYNLTFTGMERTLSPQVDQTAIDAMTIVAGL